MEQLSALESWWHWNAGGTGKLVALERWRHGNAGGSSVLGAVSRRAHAFRSLRYNSLSVSHVSQKGEYLHER